MLLFVNGKTNVMFLRFRMHTHTPQIVTANNRLGKEKQKRNIVRDYNDSMPGIDRCDQMLSNNSG